MTILSSNSLFFIGDVARFALAYIVLVVVPGAAIAILARPKAPHSELLAFAVPCGYGLVTVSGLATALLHLPYGLPAYAIVAVPITFIAMVAVWRRRPATATEKRAGDRWWLLPLAVALIYLGAIALVYGGDTVPAGYDVLTHVTWITQILRAHVYPIAMLSAHIGDASGGFYPPTFHALTALTLMLAPMPVYHAAFLSVVAVVAFLPVALFTYTRIATGSQRLAGLAVLASLAFEPLPLFTQGLGLYPFVVSLLIVPAVALALRDGLGAGDRRAVGLAAFLGIGLFYTHSTEFVTVGLLALAIIPGLLRSMRAWLRAIGYGLIVGAAWFVAAFPALVAVRRTMVYGAQAEIQSTHDFTHAAHATLTSGLNFYVQWVYGRNVSYVLLIAAIMGIVWCLTTRRFLGLVAAQIILAILFVDSTSYNILRPLYVISFPWALWERMSPTHYWFVLPLAAIGVNAVVVGLQRLAQTKSLIFVGLSASPFALLGLLLPFDVTTGIAAVYAHSRDVVAPSDFGALAWLARHTAAGTVVANEGDTSHMNVFDAPSDAGRWMPVLGGPQPLFWRGGAGPGAVADRYYLLEHIADNPLPPRAARFIALYHVRYVFYGAQIRPGTTRRLHLVRLLADPRLRLAYTSTLACRTSGTEHTGSCPTGQSYIFALDRTAGEPIIP